MSAKVVGVNVNGGGGKTYEVEAGTVALTVEFYAGDAEAGERPWRADINFIVADRTLGDQGTNRREAFLAASSRHETAVRSGIPLPSVVWSDVARALEGKGAF